MFIYSYNGSFISPAIAAKPQSADKLIVKNIGIDKLGDQYEVSMLAYIPQPAETFSENYQVFSAKGITVNDAIANVSKMVGKNTALADSNLIVVNKELCEYGMLASLDSLVREYSLGNNSNIFCTDSAKEMMQVAQKIAKDIGISIQDIAEYNKEHILPAYNYLEEIYSASLSPNETILISFITLEKNEGLDLQNSLEENGQEGESSNPENQSSEEQSSNSENKDNKKIMNKGNAIVLKKGKKIMELDSKEVFDLSWGETFKDFGVVQLNNYSSNVFTNADISFYIFKNRAKIRTYFEGDLPVCEISIKPKLTLDEVEQEQLNIDFYRQTYHLGSHEILNALNTKIGKDFSKALQKMIENKCDIFDIYERFNANNTKNFKKFLRNFEEVDDFLSSVEFRINVKTTLVE